MMARLLINAICKRLVFCFWPKNNNRVFFTLLTLESGLFKLMRPRTDQ